ncbi:MAG: hypothetical protein PWP51_122 [Clostridiales bacterium]|uniref:MotA/TolQ/ExbB proton channel family protein n=1 Tax=Fusibacter paucivorans TaxID=76009 RepID=A0ABS5PLV6_9FIRM|nr:hypothetical protein [Fusibacter paucivorans]MBS7526123.1 hypothetical protein [Fusibacter paucivorans]MDK2865938.1 hypothetical protein [Clostridiales bacterium]MDN5297569.1 hypothetical protein [Clostridiales bacterium]
MIQMILTMNPVGQIIIGLIVLILIITLWALARIKTKYLVLTYDVLDHDNRKELIFKSELNNAIVDDYKSAQTLKIKEINTLAIIEKNMNTFLSKTNIGERFIGRSSGLMIILGLVGTFFGLTLSISELVSLLSSTNEAVLGDVNTITGGLLSSINGMSVAFVTSLFGITASILVNVLTIVVGTTETKEQYIAVVEEYLDNTLGEKSTDMTQVDEHGKTPLETAFESLGDRLAASLEEVTSAMSYRLTVASNNMKDTSDSIEKSMHKFDQSIQQFSENIRDFSEFNHHLKTNIQRMSVVFDDFTEDVKEANKNE